MKTRALSVSGAVVALGVYSAAGAPIDWAAAANGDWNVASNWLPAAVPGASDAVTLGLAGPYTVNMPFSQQAASISIPNPSVTLDVLGFRTLSVFGSVSNSGLIRVNPNGIGAGTAIFFGASGTLSGPGRLQLMQGGGLSDLDVAGGSVLTQAADHTIEGRGRVLANLVNFGTVSANVAANAMELAGANKTNNGLMRAIDGATLNVGALTLTQSAAGRLVANGAGSVVNLANTTLIGGRAEGINGGVLAVNIDSTMNGVRTIGSTQINGFRTLNIANSLTNDGTMTINPQLIGAGTGINFTDSSSLTGTGQLILATGGALSDVRSADGAVINHTSGHTIRGRGRIIAAITNNGLISADVTGQPMEISGVPKTNNATIESTNGATLNIVSTTIGQSANASILAQGTDSVVNIGNSTITGGRVRTISPGVIAVNLDSTFDGVRTIGTVNVLGFRTLSVRNGLTNSGVITVNSNVVGAGTGIRFLDSSVLDGVGGVGAIVLNANGSLADISTAANETFTQGPSHRIVGRGRIVASMLNNGLISANVAGGTMEISGEPKTNNATIEAVGGGVSSIRTTILQTGPGRITADGTGSTVRLEGATVMDGVVAGVNGGSVLVIGLDSTLDGVRFEGSGDVTGFRTLHVSGGLTNNGLIRVNPDQVGAGTRVNFMDSSSLSGTGIVRLSAATNLSEFRSDPGQTVTQQAGHTIEGRGRISAALVNNGLVRANVTGQGMEIEGVAKSNNAQMRSEGGAILTLLNTTVNQGASGRVLADGAGSILDLTNATVNNGSIEGLNGGVVRVINSEATINGVTVVGDLQVFGFRTLTVGAGGVNNGMITVNPSQIGASTNLSFSGNHTLGGNGTVRLGAGNALANLTADAGVTLVTLGSGQRLEGIGRVAVPVEMRGTIAPGLSVGTLNAINEITMTPTAIFEAEVSAPETADRVSSSSAFVADGTLDVRFVDGFNPATYWGATIVTANQGVSGRFDTILAPAPADPRLAVRARYLPTEIRIGAVCKPDINFDGVLNFFDISGFISLYNIQDPDADIAAPFGVWNFFDIAAYIAQYNGGCP